MADEETEALKKRLEAMKRIAEAAEKAAKKPEA